MIKWLLFVGTIFFLSACATNTPPLEDYVLADTAIKAAKSVQAVRYASNVWHQAEEYYRQARILYKEREYVEAKELFILARKTAEKAENTARVIRQKNGEFL